MRRYYDRLLGQQMLLRVVVEEDGDNLVVVSVFRTSKVTRYLPLEDSP
jgi:hypothetical protein